MTQAAKLANIGSVIAIILASLGLFSLSSYETIKRSKEFGIRKVLGASVLEVFIMQLKRYSFFAILGLIIAVPIAWWIMNIWLANFAYRIDLSYSFFILGGIISILVSWVAVSIETIRGAMVNPVDMLRDE